MRFRFGNSLRGNQRLEAISLLAFALWALAPGAQAEPASDPAQSGIATLHINVVVVPVVQTHPPAAATQVSGTVIYNLQTPPLSANYEIHSLPPDAQNGKRQPPAILRTLAVVPR